MEKVNFTERELNVVLDSVVDRLENILNDDDLKDIVGRFDIAHMIDVVEKLGKPDWAKEYRNRFDYINFNRMNYVK